MARRHKVNLSRRAGPNRDNIPFVSRRDSSLLELHQYLALGLEFFVAKSMVQNNQNQVITLDVYGRYIKCRHTVPLVPKLDSHHFNSDIKGKGQKKALPALPWTRLNEAIHLNFYSESGVTLPIGVKVAVGSI